MIKYGLIGKNLSHSFSKKYFKEKFEKDGISDVEYALFEIAEIADFPKILSENPHLKGLNVTIPYKQTVIPFLNEIDPTASEVGAVNVIKITESGRLKGYNTDIFGFQKSLENWLPKTFTENTLILGTGGAAQAVHFVLKKHFKNVLFATSSKTTSGNFIHYDDLNAAQFADFQLIVNCTPLGTYPKTAEKPPIPENYFFPKQFVLDLIYNPNETLLLRQAKSAGCTTKNGMEMLVFQAEEAYSIWQK